MECQVLQVKSLYTREFGFEGLDFKEQWTGSRDAYLPLYYVAYEGNTQDLGITSEDGGTPTVIEILRELWVLFNRDNRPNGQTMRSMSVSDIVYIADTHYYCDSYGWKQVDVIGKPGSEDDTRQYRRELA